MAKKATIQTKLIEALRARGETEVKSLHNCVVMTHGGSTSRFYYIGTMGSLRYGRTRSGSIAAPNKGKALLLAEWEKRFGQIPIITEA